jgi:[ribosomal protein S5]-alanine N-acetyltransferase
LTARDASTVNSVIVEGARILLRDLTDADAPAVHRWAGDPRTVEFVPLGPLDGPSTVNYVAQLVTQARRRPRLGYTFAIERRVDSEVVGSVSLEVDSFEHRRAEIGYILRRDAWGQGFATEATALVRDFAFDHLHVHRLWAVCDPDNPASAAVLRKVGMRLEGTMRGDLLVRGRWRDSLLHAMLVEDRPAPAPRYL